MIHVGVDENGLGPRLGPLIVTAVTARVTGEGEPLLQKPARGALAERLGDSKALVSYGDSALGEAWARALQVRDGDGHTSASALLAALSLDSTTKLQSLCPDDDKAQCWDEVEGDRVASGEMIRAAELDLERLRKRGVTIESARVVVVCVRALNQAFERGESRLLVDLHSMERLVLDARERTGEEVTAVCGKVGGFDKYGPHFGPLGGRLHAAMSEERAKSEYRFPGVGTVSFVRDADAGHLLVSLASLVGKWVRDLLMRRIVLHHQAHAPDAPDASGYYDPVTARFVAATALSRKNRGLSELCFERVRSR